MMIGRWKRRGNHLATARLAVRRHVPWPLQLVLGAGVLGVMGMAGVWLYQHGEAAGLATAREIQVASGQQANLARLQSELLEVRQRLMTTEQQWRVERAAWNTLSQQVAQYQAENANLREQLSFYEALLTRTDRAPALSLESFRSEALSPGRYRLRVVLVQGQSAQAPFRGELDFRLSYEHDGRPQSLIWPTPRLPVSVARFGRFEPDVTLPDGARLRHVEVRVYAQGDNRVKLSRNYDVRG
jgi:hypothetical protein